MINFVTATQLRPSDNLTLLAKQAKPKNLFDLSPSPKELESILGDSEETLDFYLTYATSNDKLAHIAQLYKLRGDAQSFEAYWKQITNPLLQRSLKEYSLRRF